MQKWGVLGCSFVVGVALQASAVTLSLDRVQQRYPWNGLVDIDYTMSYAPGTSLTVDDNFEVLMIDKSSTPAVTNRAITFLQEPQLGAGRHRITWDANADGVTNATADAVFQVKIVHYAATYMVIDVSDGPTKDFRVDFLNGEPVGGFNTEEYQTGKIVLRRIHPTCAYTAGSPSSPLEAGRNSKREVQHWVALSRPYYIGIFEVTQQQYYNVTGSKPSTHAGDFWQRRPVETVRYNDVRGGDWPATPEPGAGTFMDKLQKKCVARDPVSGEYTLPVTGFDLPTEFQWEYACRAGTTGAFNTTNEYDNTSADEQAEQLALLGRYKDNQDDGKGGISQYHTLVGSYQPNYWGLYDMHGNVRELCRDRFTESVASLGQIVDPEGPSSGVTRVWRGGGWNHPVSECRSAYRYDASVGNGAPDVGFRLSRTLP